MLSILVVDDEPGIGRLMEIALSAEGFSVLTAKSGEEALSMSENLRPEIGLLITDIMMPGMNGLQLACSLRATDPSLPVLYMSAFCDTTHLTSLGGNSCDLMEKPFSIKTLLTQVRCRVRQSR